MTVLFSESRSYRGEANAPLTEKTFWAPHMDVSRRTPGDNPIPRRRLVIVEDCAEVQDALRLLLEPEHDLLGVAVEEIETLRLIVELRPDVLLLDVSLPGLNGFEIARRVRDSGAGVRILFVSQRLQREYIEEARRIGAAGYVQKSRIRTDLLPAIRAVTDGRLFFPKELS